MTVDSTCLLWGTIFGMETTHSARRIHETAEGRLLKENAALRSEVARLRAAALHFKVALRDAEDALAEFEAVK
jgi:hypothetical protein